jgi:hypothetical protein
VFAVFFDYQAVGRGFFDLAESLCFLSLNAWGPSAYFGQKENRVEIQLQERCLYTKAAGYSLPIILLDLTRLCKEKTEYLWRPILLTNKFQFPELKKLLPSALAKVALAKARSQQI